MASQKQKSSIMFLIIPSILLLAAVISCTFDVGIVQPTPPPNTESDNDIQEHDLAAIADSEEQGVQPSPSETDVDCQESPLAGLVFGTKDEEGESLWQVGTCEDLIQLYVQSNLNISPDGEQAIYTKDDDIWIVDLLNR